MADFSQQIANYKNYGTYIYKFDSVGNEVLNPSSSIFQQVYFSLPFGNVVYDDSKLLSFYDPTFSEFIPATSSQQVSVFPQEAIDEIDAITYDNIQLQNQLNAFLSANEQDSGAADVEAVRNIIIGLRIQLGQGVMATDFDTIFPYLPIPAELKDSTTSVQVVPSSAAITIQPTILTTTTITSNTEQPPPTPSQTSSLGELTDSERAAISASAATTTAASTTPSSGVVAGQITYLRIQKDVITNNHLYDNQGRPIGGGYVSYVVKIVDKNNNQIGNQTFEINSEVKQNLYMGKTVSIKNVKYKAIDPKKNVAFNQTVVTSNNFIGFS